MKKYKWGTIVPLIGGMSVAGKVATGENPDFLLSYKAFEDHEKNIRNYFPDTPYEVLDNGGDLDTGKNADFISALCPCAGISTFTNSTKEVKESANSWMFQSAHHVLGNLQPKVFFGENAPGLYEGVRGVSVSERLQELAKKYGYTMTFYYTNTMLHGVPQRRHRTFYFFWKEDGKVPMMNYWNRPHKSFKDYLKEVPKDASQHKEDFERATTKLTSGKWAKFAHAHYGKDFPNLIREEVRKKRKQSLSIQEHILSDPGLYLKMKEWYTKDEQVLSDPRALDYFKRIDEKFAQGKGIWDESPLIFLPESICNAIIGKNLNTAHPSKHRSLTIREAMHMMALPHDFELVSKNTNHICQNVPVCTGADMHRDVLLYLDGKLPLIEGNVIWQNNFTQKIDRHNYESKLLSW